MRFALRSAASRVQGRCAVISRTPRLPLPSSLAYGGMSIPGEHAPAYGRLYDGGGLRAPPLHSGGECDRSCAVKAQARSLAVRALAGRQRHHSLCHAGPASGAGPRRLGRCVGAFWSEWFWGVCSALRSRRDQCPVAIPPCVEPTFRAGQFPADILYGVACQIAVNGLVSALGLRFCHGGLLGGLLPYVPDCSLFSMSWHNPIGY